MRYLLSAKVRPEKREELLTAIDALAQHYFRNFLCGGQVCNQQVSPRCGNRLFDAVDRRSHDRQCGERAIHSQHQEKNVLIF